MRINFYDSLCSGAFFERSCLNFQIDEAIGGKSWQKEAISIEGFTFEFGYIYEIEVKITALDTSNCQDDCPTHRYVLVREVSKTAVEQECKYPWYPIKSVFNFTIPFVETVIALPTATVA